MIKTKSGLWSVALTVGTAVVVAFWAYYWAFLAGAARAPMPATDKPSPPPAIEVPVRQVPTIDVWPTEIFSTPPIAIEAEHVAVIKSIRRATPGVTGLPAPKGTVVKPKPRKPVAAQPRTFVDDVADALTPSGRWNPNPLMGWPH